MEINALATKKVISYEDAEEKLREAADPDLISKVKKYKTQINQSRRIPGTGTAKNLQKSP